MQYNYFIIEYVSFPWGNGRGKWPYILDNSSIFRDV